MRNLSLADPAYLAAGTGVLWTPAAITTSLWLDASDASTVTTSSDLISQVNDKSGNGRNFTATGAVRPTYTSNGLNGLPVITLNGSQYLTTVNTLSTWNFLHTTSSTIIAVWQAGNTSDPNAAYGLIGNNATATASIGFTLFFDDRASASRNEIVAALYAQGVVGNPCISNFSGNGAHPVNTGTILLHHHDPDNIIANNRSFLRVNGGSNIFNNTSTNAPRQADATFPLQIGTTGNATFPLVGYIAEFVILNYLATTTIRQNLEGYLAWKWGLTSKLPSTHPYRFAPPVR